MSAVITRQASLRQLIELAALQLREVADEPRSEAERLWAHVLNLSRAGVIARDALPPEDRHCTDAAALIARRASGEPFAYLMGEQGFWTLDLRVSPEVLIPRPDTETLVEWALEWLPESGTCRVADLGTGSGAIALAIASERPMASVVATDVYQQALNVAAANASRLNLSANIEFQLGDWCAALPSGAFDLIVSNPPYIAAGDPHLPSLRFEPLSALVSGDDGLDAIRIIVREAASHLRAGGALLIEHGAGQGAAVRELMAAADYSNIETRRDLEDRERVTGGVRP